MTLKKKKFVFLITHLFLIFLVFVIFVFIYLKGLLNDKNKA